MSFKLMANFVSGPSCEVTDQGIRGAVAKWFQELATSAASSAAEAPTKRGPGRPSKSNASQAAATTANEEVPLPEAP
jgi:hypothetical protein